MRALDIRPLEAGLAFGSRVRGVTEESTRDPAVRQELNRLFEDRGLILFEEVAPSSAMHVAISEVFGPLKDHPVASVARVDDDLLPGVIDILENPSRSCIVEIGGKQLATWLPWHFDHCYNNELNRAGVLRALKTVPEGGRTGFVDGIQLYHDLPADLRDAIADKRILYTLELSYDHMRFGRPEGFRLVREHADSAMTSESAKKFPRAIHPAVWTRASGERVLHVSPWGAVGVEGHEDAEGDALLEAVCQEIARLAEPYFHTWTTSDMLIWDNWRVLHSVSGHSPNLTRHMQRTTIRGDYGLGSFENGGAGGKELEVTV